MGINGLSEEQIKALDKVLKLEQQRDIISKQIVEILDENDLGIIELTKYRESTFVEKVLQTPLP